MRETNEDPLLCRRPSLFLFFYFFLCLPLALSLLRVLDTREFRLASALTLLSIVHRPVVLSSRLRPSSSCLRSEQSEAETRRASFSQTADLVSPTVDAAVPSFSCSIFLSVSLSPPPSWTTQSRSPPFLSFSPLAPFFHCLSLLSLSLVISNISPVLLFLYFCSYRSSYATFFSLVLSMPLFPFYFLFSLPILSVLLLLLYLYSSRKIQARIFFLLPTLIHVDISARRTNRPTDE